MYMTIDEMKARYELDYKWRKAWTKLACKHELGRLQSRQEKIERRARIANNRIAALMHQFDELRHNAPAERDVGWCADCGGRIGQDNGPSDGWQLEDGRTVCHACCGADTKRVCDEMISLYGKVKTIH
jgi:hypothetical protein